MDCPTFRGTDEEDFAIWHTAFEQVYPSTMLGRERFLGLQTMVLGQAQELLTGLSASDASYDECMARLFDKYGQPAEVKARLKHNFKSEAPVKQPDDPAKLQSLYEKIRTMVFSYNLLDE